MTLYEEALSLLQQLIRNACVNDLTSDSGQEIANALTLEEFFGDLLAPQGPVQVQRFEPRPGRRSVAFTVPGSDPVAEPLTLLGHIDVVPVDTSKWSVDPFGAEIIDGKLYGRGAVDMLFISASMAAVTADIARVGTNRGTLTFVALADEESRGGWGAGWIAEHQPEAFSWKNALSETGGSHLPVADGSDAIVINVGEKGAAQRRLTISGDAGHGSTPFGKDFATVKIAEVAKRLAQVEFPLTGSDTWRRFVRAFRFDLDTEKRLLTNPSAEDYEVFGSLNAYAHAFSHTTASQTVLRAGGPINVLPSTAWLELDIRPLPGVTQEDIDATIIQALGDLAAEVTLEHLITEPASESPAEGPLWEAMVATIKEDFPDAAVIPVLATGGSDLRFARRLGGVGYGFALHARQRTLAEANKQLHSHDEHLHLEDLRLTLHAYRRLLHRFLC